MDIGTWKIEGKWLVKWSGLEEIEYKMTVLPGYPHRCHNYPITRHLGQKETPVTLQYVHESVGPLVHPD